MSAVIIARALHVGLGAFWALSTLAIAVVGRSWRIWLALQLAAGLGTMLVGIYLWHALHAGPWGSAERLLTIGTFCALVAFGMQVPVAAPMLARGGAVGRPALIVYRVSAAVLAAAAALMVASRYV